MSKNKLEKLGKLVTTIIKNKYKKRRHCKYGNINKGFTEEELNRFLSTVTNPKAYLAFSLMSHLGLRVSEVVKIKSSDIDWANNKIRISTLKAQTGDFLYLPKRIQILLKGWIQKYTKEIAEHNDYVLFSGNKLEKRLNISQNWLRWEFRNVAVLCNLNEWYDYADGQPMTKTLKNRKLYRLTTHSFRHFFITKCYAHCKNPVLTQKLARHTDFKSTQVYININYEKMGKIIEEVFDPQTATQKEELVEFMEMYARFKQVKNQ